MILCSFKQTLLEKYELLELLSSNDFSKITKLGADLCTLPFASDLCLYITSLILGPFAPRSLYRVMFIKIKT